MALRIILALALALAGTGIAAAADSAPTVEAAWARATIGRSDVGVAYATVASPVADRLTSVETPVAAHAQLHSHRMNSDGTMEMRAVEALPLEPGKPVVTTVGSGDKAVKIEGSDGAKIGAALKAAGYADAPDKSRINWVMAELILVIMVVYVTMVYGPIAAFLVELFPTQIRYTSMSLPYHIGNGWFGGMLPLTATAMVAATGDIYLGLWYPISVALMSLVIGTLFLTETRERDIRTYDHSMLP